MAYLLIVDDDEDFAGATAMALRHAGHEVKIEVSPSRAVKTMGERRPDLVILDVMFPEDISGGFELARTIQHEDEKLRGIPILMLTAVNQRFPLEFGPGDIGSDCLPVADFLEKPVDLDVLCDEVARLLERVTSTKNIEEA
jgi:DNA-binding response OmpR family regulator